MHVDEHHDDCRRASYSKRRKDDGGGVVARLEFIRSFDTCHLDDYKEEDYLIEDGTVHVVYASGSGPLYRLAFLSAFVDFMMAGLFDYIGKIKQDQWRLPYDRRRWIPADAFA